MTRNSKILQILAVGFIAVMVTMSPVEARSRQPRLTYHHGRLLSNPVVHLLFWQPRGSHFQKTNKGDRQYVRFVTSYFQHVSDTPYLRVLQQYSRHRAVLNKIRLGGGAVDATPMPTGQKPSEPLLDYEFLQEIDTVASNKGWSLGTYSNTIVFVFIPKNVYWCYDTTTQCDFQATPTTRLVCSIAAWDINIGPYVWS